MNKFVLAILGLVGGLSLVATDSLPAPLPLTTSAIPVPVWSDDTVAPGGGLNAIAIGDFEQPHVVLVDTASQRLLYGGREDTGWHIEDIAPFPVVAPPAELAVDLTFHYAEGAPYVAYVDAAENKLYLAHPVAGVWQREELGAGGRLLSVRIDLYEYIHIVLVSGQTIRYLLGHNGVWLEESIGEPNNYVWGLFLDVDHSGRPHVAGTGANGSFYATREGAGEWSVQSLEVANIEAFALFRGSDPYLLLTEAEPLWGRPPFSRVTLYLASYRDGEWHKQALWTDDDWYVESDLAASDTIPGDEDALHIVYYDAQGRPHYVIAPPGEPLHRERPFPFGTGEISLALDSTGRPYVAHYDGAQLIVSTRQIKLYDQTVYLPLGLH
ncbi:MAG: hypothetical protein KA170_00810 [Candidatus Promineofilum sp.]|nr:hypothetical protein [Promineifilum sp.]